MERLADVVRARLEDSPLDADARAVVLAACEGEAGLPHDERTAATPTAGAYLRSLVVEGFRGIGPSATLGLVPGPGLTLVVGRNGSGKSSFAEALELLITGDSHRWAKRTSVWKEGWQNLHHQGDTSVKAEFDVAGLAGPLVVWRTWAPGAGVTSGAATSQVKGEPQRPYGEVGWAPGLATFRPFLSYNELGSILDEGPSKLFDALSTVLGLDEIVEIADRLARARKAADEAVKAVRARATRLGLTLAEADDERASAARAILAAKAPDLDRLERLLGAEGPEGEADADVALLGRLAGLAPPAEDPLGLAERLRRAAVQVEAVGTTDAGEAKELADLLDAALDHHRRHRLPDCPVCETPGALSEGWADRTGARVADLRHRARAAEEASRRAEAEFTEARGFLDPAPAVLGQAGDVGLNGAPAQRAWEEWASWEPPADGSRPAVLQSLASHLEDTGPAVKEAVERLTDAASEAFQRRQDAWRPLAQDLTAWLVAARNTAGQAEKVAVLKRSEDWLKGVSADVRDERFAPIAGAAKGYWDLLRQQSNVELGRIVLEGTATRRKVVLDVSVDGVSGSALGVMSQGELHALALSLFLPRATLPESPFRFLVIDDPVQSMDPARVDGLARVLDKAAGDRQVIVFTHDDRLPEAIRRLGIAARVLEVTRRLNSAVELRNALDPVSRALDDANALARTTELPEQAARRVVPGLCRVAIEARCAEVVWRRRLGKGARHADVEAALLRADRLSHRVALALFDDASKAGDVLGRLNRFGSRAADAYQRCNRGAHEVDRGDLLDLVKDVQVLVTDLGTMG